MKDIHNNQEASPAESLPTPGRRIHDAETAIGIGRRTILELVQQEPIDEEALASARQEIADAREERRLAMRELKQNRLPVPIMPAGMWWPR